MKFTVLNYLIMAVMCFEFISCKTLKSSYQTQCFNIETEGYTTIKIWNNKLGRNYNFKQAQKDAIHSILFSGIIGTNGCSTQPPILNSSEEKDKFNKIEKSFFSNNGSWSMFSRGSTEKFSLLDISNFKNGKTYQISISKNELRKYLENQKIIKSFSTGF